MPIDDVKEFQIDVIQQFPVFHGVSMPASLCAFNPPTATTYTQLIDWGCNSVYIRLFWGADNANGCGPEPDEYAVGDPVTGAGYSQSNINKIKTQVNLARNAGIYPWIGVQNTYNHLCPPAGSYGWADPYLGDFINMNTQPNHCSTGVKTPMPGRQRYLNLLQYLCTQFDTDVALIPWDFPYHNNGTTPVLSDAARTQFYAQPDGTQALMIKRIRETDAIYWPNAHPRYLGISPISQGAGIDSNGYSTATGELEHYQPFYASGPPFYGEYIWYGYDSHDAGRNHVGHPSFPYTSCWGYIVRAADPGTGVITHWDYNMTNYDIMWSGVPGFKAKYPSAKVICWEWIGLAIHFSKGTGVAEMGNRPIDQSRLNWAHNMFNTARTHDSGYMFFDWWGPRSEGKPLSAASPTEGGGTDGYYEHPPGTNGAPNTMAWMLRYHNTYSISGTYLWSDSTYHTLPQNGQPVPPWI